VAKRNDHHAVFELLTVEMSDKSKALRS